MRVGACGKGVTLPSVVVLVSSAVVPSSYLKVIVYSSAITMGPSAVAAEGRDVEKGFAGVLLGVMEVVVVPPHLAVSVISSENM